LEAADPLSLGWMLIVAGFLISWRWGLLMFAAVSFAWIVLTRAFELGKTRESGPERVLPTVGERPIPGRVIPPPE